MLKCPHCDKELESKACRSCGTWVPAQSHYCLQCGALLKDPALRSGSETDEFDPENRILCPDGACTGIIENGKCTVCGKSNV